LRLPTGNSKDIQHKLDRAESRLAHPYDIDLLRFFAACVGFAVRQIGTSLDNLTGAGLVRRTPKVSAQTHVLASGHPLGDWLKSLREVAATQTERLRQSGELLRTLADRLRAERLHTQREQQTSARLAEALQLAEAARAAAEEANRTKDVFLGIVSHELRTPLTPILAWARLLRQGKLDEEATRHALETIERSAKCQAQIIDDLLEVSRIIAGKMRIEVSPVHLARVIEAAVEVMRPAAEAKAIQLQAVLDIEVGAVLGNAERLQQVVWNLLANAVKFTPQGGRVEVRLGLRDSLAEIVVSDTGQGIRPDFLPFVFERFRQADSATTRGHGGLGLGLAIVRHLAEAHGGTVHAESPGPGQGAVFTVKLPLMRAPTAGEAERHPTPGVAENEPDLRRLDGLHILLVDDEADSNEAVGNLLASCGADVRAAGSAADARDILAGWQADVLVSDIGMPDEDGYALIASLRAKEGEVAQIPAVALTAYASREEKVKLLSAGFQAHVPKPLEAPELVAVIASLGQCHGQAVRRPATDG
jgi:signal transduction histidine kinase/ActR/RegA family two-component response regulator